VKKLKAKEERNPNVDLHNFSLIGQNFIRVKEEKIQVQIFKASQLQVGASHKLEEKKLEKRKIQLDILRASCLQFRISSKLEREKTRL
jgi:hypothetical protein